MQDIVRCDSAVFALYVVCVVLPSCYIDFLTSIVRNNTMTNLILFFLPSLLSVLGITNGFGSVYIDIISVGGNVPHKVDNLIVSLGL